ncbi:uncharacterized protein LOC126990094 [Eriocheir sinensis]|uniref:uncharacterized protein LOC126990094 n=1 Tax=Eriocheir sinensis TaxID=95602 RepID=UPI0021C74F98|nr:uncharacterized protein LOC126990094 [Eriocheir sinensis]
MGVEHPLGNLPNCPALRPPPAHSVAAATYHHLTYSTCTPPRLHLPLPTPVPRPQPAPQDLRPHPTALHALLHPYILPPGTPLLHPIHQQPSLTPVSPHRLLLQPLHQPVASPHPTPRPSQHPTPRRHHPASTPPRP